MEISFGELKDYESLSPESKVKFLERKQQEEQERIAGSKKKNSPFNDWLQVNNSEDAYNAESWLIRHSSIAYQILRFLTNKMNGYNAIICSFKVMEEALGYKRTSLSNAVSLLKAHGYIDVQKSGTSNVYLINKKLYWKSWGSNYRYAEFGAKIILSESEQEPKTKTNRQRTTLINEFGEVETVDNTIVTMTEQKN